MGFNGDLMGFNGDLMVICADMCFDCFPDFPAGSMPCNIQNYYNFEDVKLKVIKTNAIETEHIFGDR